MVRAIQSIIVGKKDVKLTAPSHVWGVREGNSPHALEKKVERDARRATSINPEDEEPIDPNSPRLPPA